MRIAASQVIVGGQDVYSAAMQREPGYGRYGRERLPFSSLHLDDVPARKTERSENLHIEHPEPENPLGNNGGQREGLSEVRAATQELRGGFKLLVGPAGELFSPTCNSLQLNLGRGIHETEETQQFS
jgi:hypothetical protein